jgi:uncharacterized paraquat-inducible protein A
MMDKMIEINENGKCPICRIYGKLTKHGCCPRCETVLIYDREDQDLKESENDFWGCSDYSI